MKRVVVLAALLGCTPSTPVTVVEVPPQDLPTPDTQATAVATFTIASPSAPFRSHEEWAGTYTCAQGQTNLVVRIEQVRGTAVDAVFEFSVDSSNTVGAYRMSGSFTQGHAVHFTPGVWIDKPNGSMTVGMTGEVHGDVFFGHMDNPSCTTFIVRRR